MTEQSPCGPLQRLVMRAFAGTAHGLTCITFATTASKARTNVVRSANDAGYTTTYADVRIRRAPEHDALQKLAEAHASRGTCFAPEYLSTHNAAFSGRPQEGKDE